MKKMTFTARDIRQAKMLSVAPVVVVSLLTLIFWALNGGKGPFNGDKTVAKGFDMRVPGPHVLSVTKLDKMGYYEKAKHDSMSALQKQKIQDNYAKMAGFVAAPANAGPDSVVRQVHLQLEKLKRVIAAPSQNLSYPNPRPAPAPNIERLEKLAGLLRHEDGGSNEIAGLTAVVEKLATLQNPHRDTVNHKIGLRPQPPALSVKALPDEDDTTGGPAAIEAIIPDDQVLTSGSELRLELTHDIGIGNQRIPAGTPLFGEASLTGERLRIVIHSIAWHDRLFTVNLQVHDEDGLPGIYIPGAPISEAVRESAGEALSTAGPTIVTTNLAGQATGAGVTLARSLIGKKVRPVHVTIPAGYHVLLHPQNSNQ